MKKLFFWLLKRYSKNEKARWEIHKVLNENVSSEYPEQTVYGNVYNSYIEFVMANEFIRKIVKEKDETSIKMIELGIADSFETSICFIRNEKDN